MYPAAARVINYKGTFWVPFYIFLFFNMTFIFLSH
ncbi:Uncharacterised protein [Klebsiella pneumoniae]|uniref:Uncharacterized protein n=1 Tax=Klebsiella pneumoniae TaxID=573 RepID=A0A658ZN97_KLEPN|nr:hypothetical protein PMK1_00095 [Klebsiella pneumoniae]ERN58960.1 hypothetical protein N598_16515 [Klebsiella pneumoniae 303K]ESM14072.1 hypothetical protein L415_02785 [Klebsiella pneumoniae UCICRE 4]ESM77681.1 hypothetical protein L392_00336 [Klebsiella pneumoniae MGH 46]EZQ81236.1 hypothetical protein AF49_01724 [Klebsiella pneumoniae MGH 63]EZR24345.1 hypothetical protein AE01_02606 [Klebsiella pneumoniae MGH 75]KDL45428.1 hypothetical protein AF51_02566 [Klebsiella pneumoniae MGH 65]